MEQCKLQTCEYFMINVFDFPYFFTFLLFFNIHHV